jgi:lysophospholipase L1-like esterase
LHYQNHSAARAGREWLNFRDHWPAARLELATGGCTGVLFAAQVMLQPSRQPGRRNPLAIFALGLMVLAVGIHEFRSTVLAEALVSSLRELQRPNKITPAAPGTIIFTGASSLAYWDSLAKDMKPLPIINTAFGGAEYSDLNSDLERLVIAYRPAAVVVYAGDNDLASADRKTPQSVTNDVRTFVQGVHASLPDTWVYVLSIKPSHARWNVWPNMKEADGLIQDFLRTQDHAQFIDVATPMFDAHGDLPNDLFVSDGLHPSAKCYALWTSIIKPVLLQRFGPSASPSNQPR